MERSTGSRLMQMQARNHYRSYEHMNWWEPEHWKPRGPRSVSSVSLEADPGDIRNGWLTLPDKEARFQQRQMQEREMKIASLYEAQQARALDRVRHSPSSGGVTASPPSQPPICTQPGKVRQMFEERRTKAGIDKSYPLQPIHNTGRNANGRAAKTNGFAKVTSTTTTSNSRVSERKATKTSTVSHSLIVRKQQQVTHKASNNMANGRINGVGDLNHRVNGSGDLSHKVNGSGDLNHNHEPNFNTIKQKPHSNGEMISHPVDELDRADNNYMLENETFPEAMAPTPTPRSPEPQQQREEETQPEPPKRPPRRSPVVRNEAPSPRTAAKNPVAPPRKVVSENGVPESSSKARGAMHRTNSVSKPLPRKASSPLVPGQASSGTAAGRKRSTAAQGPDSGVPCAECGRRFAPDRVEKHQEICRKAANKKRKPFDALKHRLAGTEAEPFIGKLRKQGASGTTSTTKVKTLNNNWRQKHEDFINAIRSAKQVQAHLKAGGKLSDLPPPPPSENPDYVQCPHCGRRFNEAAAERHIPKCASYQFNKPKPGGAPRKR